MPRISSAKIKQIATPKEYAIPEVDLFEGLNGTQRAVVEHEAGNAAMYAVAGSGKTRSVVHRIANLVRKGHDPERILATTFTKKAAGEMNERLAKLGVKIRERKGDGGARVGTFHSVCWEIVRDGSPWQAYQLDDKDRMKYKLKDIVGWKGMKWKGVDVTEVINFISRAKNDLLSPDDTDRILQARKRAYFSPGQSVPDDEMDWFNGVDLQFVEAYYRYEDERNRAGLITFDDMLKSAVEWLRMDRNARQRWQGRYDHVVIDEYQDSNRAQYELMRLLSVGCKSLLVAGDDDQCIFQWRGSRQEYTLTFEKVFGAEGFRAEANYRCRPEILEVANAVIKNNDPNRVPKVNQAQRQPRGEGTVEWYPCEDMDAEAEVVVQRVKELRQQVGIDEIKYSDMAVLYRTNAQSRAFEEALLREKIPHVVVNGTDFYSRKEVADVLAYLRVAVDDSDDKACERAINRPFRYIGRASIDKLKDIAKRNRITLMQAVCDHAEQVGLQHRQVQSLRDFAGIVDWIREEVTELEKQRAEGPLFQDPDIEIVDQLGGKLSGVPHLISQIIMRTGYEQWLLSDEGSDTAENSRVSNLRELVRTSHRFNSPAELLEHVEHVREQKKKAKKGKADAVLLMTIHSAKGLEWPAVFLAGASEGILPHARADEDDSEERRLFYVAVTRAREFLLITSPMAAVTGGGLRSLDVSRFVKEGGLCGQASA